MKSILTFDQMKPILKNRFAKAIFDNYPVNKGHMLVIPYDLDHFKKIYEKKMLGLTNSAILNGFQYWNK